MPLQPCHQGWTGHQCDLENHRTASTPGRLAAPGVDWPMGVPGVSPVAQWASPVQCGAASDTLTLHFPTVYERTGRVQRAKKRITGNKKRKKKEKKKQPDA